MPFLKIDLDAKRRADFIARAHGLDPQKLVGGLVDAWEYAWRDGAETIDEMVFHACFGTCPKLRHSLAGPSGFFEADGSRYRVRGAKSWLFAKEARRKGGLAAKGNLIPGARHRKKPTVSPDVSSAEPTNGLGCVSAAADGQPTASPDVSSAETRTRTQNPEPRTQKPEPSSPQPPVETPDAVDRSGEVEGGSSGFWSFSADERRARGLPIELTPPPGFDEWHRRAVRLAGAGLGIAYGAYLDDDKITADGHPMAVFMRDSVWAHRVPPGQLKRRRRLL